MCGASSGTFIDNALVELSSGTMVILVVLTFYEELAVLLLIAINFYEELLVLLLIAISTSFGFLTLAREG